MKYFKYLNNDSNVFGRIYYWEALFLQVHVYIFMVNRGHPLELYVMYDAYMWIRMNSGYSNPGRLLDLELKYKKDLNTDGGLRAFLFSENALV